MLMRYCTLIIVITLILAGCKDTSFYQHTQEVNSLDDYLEYTEKVHDYCSKRTSWTTVEFRNSIKKAVEVAKLLDDAKEKTIPKYDPDLPALTLDYYPPQLDYEVMELSFDYGGTGNTHVFLNRRGDIIACISGIKIWRHEIRNNSQGSIEEYYNPYSPRSGVIQFAFERDWNRIEIFSISPEKATKECTIKWKDKNYAAIEHLLVWEKVKDYGGNTFQPILITPDYSDISKAVIIQWDKREAEFKVLNREHSPEGLKVINK